MDFSSVFNTPYIQGYQPGKAPMSNFGMPLGVSADSMNNMQAASQLANTTSGGFSGLFGNFLPSIDNGKMSSMGWGMPLINMGSSLLNGYLGFKQLGLAEDSLNFQKDAFSKQFENQRTLTNAELRDRQAARVASNPTAYQSVDDYMKANAV